MRVLGSRWPWDDPEGWFRVGERNCLKLIAPRLGWCTVRTGSNRCCDGSASLWGSGDRHHALTPRSQLSIPRRRNVHARGADVARETDRWIVNTARSMRVLSSVC
jgi:hypothetical protein